MKSKEQIDVEIDDLDRRETFAKTNGDNGGQIWNNELGAMRKALKWVLED